MSAPRETLPERPKEGAGNDDGEKGPSKNALKKAAKDKEKVGEDVRCRSVRDSC